MSPEYRQAERAAFCRACDKKIAKGEFMVSWFTFRGTGQHIHICPECAVGIGELVKGESVGY